jgi:hypothetical protein
MDTHSAYLLGTMPHNTLRTAFFSRTPLPHPGGTMGLLVLRAIIAGLAFSGPFGPTRRRKEEAIEGQKLRPVSALPALWGGSCGAGDASLGVNSCTLRSSQRYYAAPWLKIRAIAHRKEIGRNE